MKISEVKYISGYDIRVTFDDGISGIVHLNDLVEKGIFKVLQDKDQFSKVYTTGSSIAWSDELEIDATKIYLEITCKNFGDLKNPKFLYAADQ